MKGGEDGVGEGEVVGEEREEGRGDDLLERPP